VTRPPERRFFVLFMGFWLPVLAYVTAIFTVSAQPNLSPPLHFLNADKVLHVGEYVVLGILLVRALRATLRVSRPLFAAMMAITAVAVVGAGDENFQRLIPGRTCDLYDFVADVVGGSLGQLVYVLFVRG
jgi:VanZ family protein